MQTPILFLAGLLSTLAPTTFAAPRYTLAVPNQVTAGKPLKGSLVIEPTSPGSIVVSLTDAKGNAVGDEATIDVDPATTSYTFEITTSAADPAGLWSVTMAGNAGFKVAGTTKINAVASATLAKILVDKPIYKPSQTLKGRVFVLTEDLLPATASITVTAEDPEKNKMARWQLKAEGGFVEFELVISDQPVLGEWTLTAEGTGADAAIVAATTETFEIAEYVLPRFSIELNVPETISMEAAGVDGITGDIAGIFTHGNAVVGSAVLELYAEKCRGYWCRRKRRDNALGNANTRPPHVLAAAAAADDDKKTEMIADNEEGGGEEGGAAASDLERRSSPFQGYFGYGGGSDDAEDDPIARTTVPLEGKAASFSFSVRADAARGSSACQVGTWEAACFTDRMSWGRALTIKATVIEAATGVEVDAEAEIATVEHDIDYTFGFDRRTYAPGMPIRMTLDAARVIDGSPVNTLPGQSSPFKPSFKVQWTNSKCGDATGVWDVDNGCSSTYSCTLTAGSCTITLDVPPTAEFIYAKVTNADGNGNDSRQSQSVDSMWSPSNTYLRAEATAAPSTPSLLTVSLKTVTSHALFAKQIAVLETSIKNTKQDQGRWGSSDDTYYSKRIETLEGQLTVKEAAAALASADFSSIMYTLVGGGTLLASGKVAAADLDFAACSDDECNAEFNIANLPTELGSTPKLVVYFVTASGEIVSDSVELASTSSLKHSLKVEFDNNNADAEPVLPGAATNVKVTVGGDSSSGSTSLVGLIAVDKSVYLLRNRRALTGADFLEAKDEATKLGYGKLSRTAEDHFDRAGIALITDGETYFADAEGTYLHYPYGYGDDDGGGYAGFGGQPEIMMADMAMDAAASPTSNAKTSTGSESSSSSSSDSDEAAAATAPRAYFPESWNELWTTMTVADGTEETVSVKAPDTITSWILGGYAVSSAHGVAVSDTSDLVVFQPFFIEMKLPYSVVRGESFELVLAIYNYEDDASAVTVTLTDGGDDFTVDGELSAKCAAVSKTAPCTVTFDVTPTSLGQIMFEVTGASPTKRDVVQRSLLVKAEGIERSYLSSAFMEPTTGADAAATLKTATGVDGVVEGSVRLMFAATANLMASSIEGLGSLVRQPTGCGEQNMVTFAPIISVRKYFEATNTLSVEMAKKTSEYMKVGYQRELTYQRTDNGFSAFGNRDDESSLWLSAFVLRSFAQSAHALEGSSAGNDGFYIDPAVVGKIAEFVVGLQKSNGEFEPSGLVLHEDMKGGVASNGASSLAAYVTLALLEARDLIADDSTRVQGKVDAAITKSVEYLKGVDVSGKTPYASALITFALVKAGVSTDAAVDSMIANVESLWTTTTAAVADADEPAHPWMYCYMTPSADVETVAYAVLVMTETDRLDEAYAASKWLVEKRGAGGGWQSTQDTVVGLEALSAYSAAVYAAQGDITVTVTAGDGFSEEVVLNQNNYDMVQTVAIPPSAAPSDIKVVAQGEGKCIVSVDVQWNEPTPTAVAPPIEIQTLLVPVENGGVRCEVCAKIAASAVAGRRRSRRNVGGGGDSAATGMALVQVQPFSGWAPASMVDTRNDNPNAKRVDNDGREGITFYLDGIGEAPTCVQLTLSQDFQVNGLKPVSVSASDYYEPSVRNDVLLSFDGQAAEGETILVGMDKKTNNNNKGDDGPNGVSPSAAMGGASSALISSIMLGLAIWFQYI